MSANFRPRVGDYLSATWMQDGEPMLAVGEVTRVDREVIVLITCTDALGTQSREVVPRRGQHLALERYSV